MKYIKKILKKQNQYSKNQKVIEASKEWQNWENTLSGETQKIHPEFVSPFGVWRNFYLFSGYIIFITS